MVRRVLQINTVVNTGSTGHIAEELGKKIMNEKWESYIAYGRGNKNSSSILLHIGNKCSVLSHVMLTRMFDLHGVGSFFSTKKFIKILNKINPDIIQLHNIHGYYLNYKLLFSYLSRHNIPIVWTFHDCWPYTGHCAYYTFAKCSEWKTGCAKCHSKYSYPTSWFLSNSKRNYLTKKEYFCLPNLNITIVTPSEWLHRQVTESFLNKYPVVTINNGINLDIFYRKEISNDLINRYNPEKKRVILGVSNVWTERKGLHDFIKLADIIDNTVLIILIGLNNEQIKKLPKNIIGIKHTDSAEQLAEFYSMANVFFNPTYEDNFPTVNIESQACGTPVVTYDVGGSSENVYEKTGFTVPVGMVDVALEKMNIIFSRNQELCIRETIEFSKQYNKDVAFDKYIGLYKKLMAENL